MAALPFDDEDYWTELLQLIRGGAVVPVVGSELLRIGPGELLYERLARDLAQVLKLRQPHPSSLNDVACRYLEEHRPRDLSRVYSAVRELLETRGYPIPEPLLALAAIEPLRLFLTTTVDSSMERAIDHVRFQDEQRTRTISYSLGFGDLPPEMGRPDAQPARPVVFHLFGTPAPLNQFALTDEDVLEYIHSLQGSTEHRPEILFQYLAGKRLLIIGSSFGDWLARFFIRSAKRERLGDRKDFVADTATQRDTSLKTFLQHFGGGMKVFKLGPEEFVRELHRRWSAEQPVPRIAARREGNGEPDELTPMERGSIFLSYAHEDRELADSIAKQLDSAGLDVWLDHRKLRLGEKFKRLINDNIAGARMFVVLISKHVLREGFFRREWRMALDRAEGMPDLPPFIVILSVDGTRIEHNRSKFPDEFGEVHYEQLANGELSQMQIAMIQTWFVEHEREAAV